MQFRIGIKASKWRSQNLRVQLWDHICDIWRTSWDRWKRKWILWTLGLQPGTISTCEDTCMKEYRLFLFFLFGFPPFKRRNIATYLFIYLGISCLWSLSYLEINFYLTFYHSGIFFHSKFFIFARLSFWAFRLTGDCFTQKNYPTLQCWYYLYQAIRKGGISHLLLCFFNSRYCQKSLHRNLADTQPCQPCHYHPHWHAPKWIPGERTGVHTVWKRIENISQFIKPIY